jgi:hypothetical protein
MINYVSFENILVKRSTLALVLELVSVLDDLPCHWEHISIIVGCSRIVLNLNLLLLVGCYHFLHTKHQAYD